MNRANRMVGSHAPTNLVPQVSKLDISQGCDYFGRPTLSGGVSGVSWEVMVRVGKKNYGCWIHFRSMPFWKHEPAHEDNVSQATRNILLS